MSLVQRFDELGHAANTRKTYLSQINKVAGKDPNAAVEWCRKAVRGRPMGTVLPMRAATLHYLVAECGWTEARAKEALPRIRRRAHPEQPRRVPSDDEIDRILDAVETLNDGSVKTALILLPQTGLRITEMVTLRMRDVAHRGGNTFDFTIKGKGGKVRVVPLPGSAGTLLGQWLRAGRAAACPRAGGAPGAPVFPGRDPHTSITDEAVRQALKRICVDLGMDPQQAFTPHALRHYYATRVLHGGADLKDVQTLLGHESIETTSRYLHTDTDRLRGAAEGAGRS